MTLKDLIEIEKEEFDKEFFWLNASYKSVKVTAFTEKEYESGKLLTEKLHRVPDELKEFLEQSITRVVTATIKDMMSNIPLTK